MMDLWTLLVETVFGGFWIAILCLALIMLAIFFFGSMSSYTMIVYLSFFLIAMALGYGYPILIVPLVAVSVYYCVASISGFAERAGGN